MMTKAKNPWRAAESSQLELHGVRMVVVRVTDGEAVVFRQVVCGWCDWSGSFESDGQNADRHALEHKREQAEWRAQRTG